MAKLKEAIDYAGQNKSSGVVILYRGRILMEQYWPLDPPEKKPNGQAYPYFHMRLGKNQAGRAIEDVASAQKSVTAMLVGIAQHKGLLKIISQPRAASAAGTRFRQRRIVVPARGAT